MSNKAKSLSIVLPAYNEEENIQRTLKATAQVMTRVPLDYEIVVVDDGSKDRTAELVKALVPSIPQIRLIQHAQNGGYGAALGTGLRNAKNQLVFFMDSDGQFDFSEITRLLDVYNNKDCQVVVGYRHKRQDHFIRKLNAFGWNSLVRFLFKFPIRDIDCGFKVFERTVLESIGYTTAVGAMVSTEMMVKIFSKGYKVEQVPVTHYPREGGKATGANIRVIFAAFRELLKLYKKLRNSRLDMPSSRE